MESRRRTGKLEGSDWKVVADQTAQSGYALAQVAESPGSVFNLCVAEASSYQNLRASVAFKAMAGKTDQGGGIVWRYQDADNYYIARMNPLEDNFRLYKVIAGKRIQLATRESLKVPRGPSLEWHTLKIEQHDDQITCYLDGKKELEAKDDAIKQGGKVGLWTKADAQTRFEQLTVEIQ